MDLGLRAVLRTAADGIVVIDDSGTILMANDATVQLFGYSLEELVGKNVTTLMPEPDRSLHSSYLERYLRTGVSGVIGAGREVRGRRKDGSLVDVHLAVSEVEQVGQRLFTGILSDITDRKRSERRLAAAASYAKAIAESRLEPGERLDAIVRGACTLAGDAAGVFLVSEDGTQLKLAAIHHPDPYAAQVIVRMFTEEPHPAVIGLLGQVHASRETLLVPEISLDLLRSLYGNTPYGRFYEHYPLRGLIAAALVSGERPLGVLAVIRTTTEIPYSDADAALVEELAGHAALAIESSRHFVEVAYRDSLTGLVNRLHFQDLLEQAVEGGPGPPFAVVFVDLDHFKPINDAHGHIVGDKVLAAAAHRLAGCVRSGDVVARWGGDEFTVLTREAAAFSVDRLMRRIREAFDASIAVRDDAYPVGVSLGHAAFPEDGRTPDALVQVADERMLADKEAKRAGPAMTACS